MKQLLTFLFLVTSSLAALAANKYVTPSGTGNGSSWSSPAGAAITNSSAAGDVIYLAGGNYGNGIPVSVSGNASSPVTIKRATAADHGTDTGWSASFDTQAAFSSGWYVTGRYLVIDGNCWKPPGLPTKFGIQIRHASGAKGIDAGGSGGNITIRDIDVPGPGINSSKAEADGIHFPPYSTISGCAVYDTDALLFSWKGNTGSTIEYCLLYNASSNIVFSGNPQDPHPDVVYSGGMFTNGTMRWCLVANVTSEGVFFDQEVPGDNMTFYGNIMFQGDCQTGNTPIQFQNGARFGNVLTYNNTFVDFNKSNIIGPGTTLGSGSKVVNNLFINYLPNWPTGVSNNGFSSTGIGSNQIINSASPFVTSGSKVWVKGSGNPPATRVTTGAPVGYNPSGMEAAFALASNSWAAGRGASVPAGMNVDLYGNSGNNLGAIQGTASPAPTATPTPVPTATPSPTVAPPKFLLNDWVTPIADATVNVRSTPSGAIVGTHVAPDRGVILGGPDIVDFNSAPVSWYRIDWEAGVSGWSGDNDLVKTTGPTPTPTPPAPTPTPSPNPSPTFEKWITKQNDWIRANPPTPD